MSDACLLYASVIALVISLVKRIPFIGKYPKVLAAVLSAGATLWPVLVHSAPIVPQLLVCFAAQLGLSVGALEVAKPLLLATGIHPAPKQDRRATD